MFKFCGRLWIALGKVLWFSAGRFSDFRAMVDKQGFSTNLSSFRPRSFPQQQGIITSVFGGLSALSTSPTIKTTNLIKLLFIMPLLFNNSRASKLVQEGPNT